MMEVLQLCKSIVSDQALGKEEKICQIQEALSPSSIFTKANGLIKSLFDNILNENIKIKGPLFGDWNEENELEQSVRVMLVIMAIHRTTYSSNIPLLVNLFAGFSPQRFLLMINLFDKWKVQIISGLVWIRQAFVTYMIDDSQTQFDMTILQSLQEITWLLYHLTKRVFLPSISSDSSLTSRRIELEFIVLIGLINTSESMKLPLEVLFDYFDLDISVSKPLVRYIRSLKSDIIKSNSFIEKFEDYLRLLLEDALIESDNEDGKNLLLLTVTEHYLQTTITEPYSSMKADHSLIETICKYFVACLCVGSLSIAARCLQILSSSEVKTYLLKECENFGEMMVDSFHLLYQQFSWVLSESDQIKSMELPQDLTWKEDFIVFAPQIQEGQKIWKLPEIATHLVLNAKESEEFTDIFRFIFYFILSMPSNDVGGFLLSVQFTGEDQENDEMTSQEHASEVIDVDNIDFLKVSLFPPSMNFILQPYLLEQSENLESIMNMQQTQVMKTIIERTFLASFFLQRMLTLKGVVSSSLTELIEQRNLFELFSYQISTIRNLLLYITLHLEKFQEVLLLQDIIHNISSLLNQMMQIVSSDCIHSSLQIREWLPPSNEGFQIIQEAVKVDSWLLSSIPSYFCILHLLSTMKESNINIGLEKDSYHMIQRLWKNLPALLTFLQITRKLPTILHDFIESSSNSRSSSSNQIIGNSLNKAEDFNVITILTLFTLQGYFINNTATETESTPLPPYDDTSLINYDVISDLIYSRFQQTIYHDELKATLTELHRIIETSHRTASTKQKKDRLLFCLTYTVLEKLIDLQQDGTVRFFGLQFLEAYYYHFRGSLPPSHPDEREEFTRLYSDRLISSHWRCFRIDCSETTKLPLEHIHKKMTDLPMFLKSFDSFALQLSSQFLLSNNNHYERIIDVCFPSDIADARIKNVRKLFDKYFLIEENPLLKQSLKSKSIITNYERYYSCFFRLIHWNTWFSRSLGSSSESTLDGLSLLCQEIFRIFNQTTTMKETPKKSKRVKQEKGSMIKSPKTPQRSLSLQELILRSNAEDAFLSFRTDDDDIEDYNEEEDSNDDETMFAKKHKRLLKQIELTSKVFPSLNEDSLSEYFEFLFPYLPVTLFYTLQCLLPSHSSNKTSNDVSALITSFIDDKEVNTTSLIKQFLTISLKEGSGDRCDMILSTVIRWHVLFIWMLKCFITLICNYFEEISKKQEEHDVIHHSDKKRKSSKIIDENNKGVSYDHRMKIVIGSISLLTSMMKAVLQCWQYYCDAMLPDTDEQPQRTDTVVISHVVMASSMMMKQLCTVYLHTSEKRGGNSSSKSNEGSPIQPVQQIERKVSKFQDHLKKRCEEKGIALNMSFIYSFERYFEENDMSDYLNNPSNDSEGNYSDSVMKVKE